MKLDPGQLRPTRLLGLCRQLLGDLDGARDAFRQATRLDPRDAEAWFFLGRVYWIQNFFDQARQALETAIRLDPRDFRSHECLALTFEALADFDRALAEYRESVKLNDARPQPSHTPPLNFGALLFKAGRLEESEVQLKRARELNPRDWQARFELGKLYGRLGKFDAAVEELRSALAGGTAGIDDRARVYRVLARVYSQMGRPEDAARAAADAESPR